MGDFGDERFILPWSHGTCHFSEACWDESAVGSLGHTRCFPINEVRDLEFTDLTIFAYELVEKSGISIHEIKINYIVFRAVLQSIFDVVTEVDVLDSEDTANLALLTRPELGITFTKLHCWRLTQFTKCVFLDADTLVINILG